MREIHDVDFKDTYVIVVSSTLNDLVIHRWVKIGNGTKNGPMKLRMKTGEWF